MPQNSLIKQTRNTIRGNTLVWFSLVVMLFCMLPMFVILQYVFVSDSGTWQHLSSTLLPTYIKNSLILMVGVAVGVLLIGVPTAWLVTVCEFPGRRLFNWALLLPLAMPAYIIAYTYTGLLDYYGPVQGLIRDMTGWGYRDYWFPQIRSIGGAIVMMTLVLYPYVYLLARAAFLEQSVCVIEASRSLGCSPRQAFWRVALPLARPAIAAGLMLALMETLADYGTVAYFGVSTFTTGIFRAWVGLQDEAGTAQLASVLLGFVSLLVLVDQLSRRRAKFHHTSNRYSAIRRLPLTKNQKIGAWLLCGVPIFLGFLLPMSILLYWSLTLAEPLNADFWQLVWHTFVLGAIAAVLAVLLGLLCSYAKRISHARWVKSVVDLASLGYALPGMVIAIGISGPLAWLDHRIIGFTRYWFDHSYGLILSGSIFALIYAYLVRFLSVSINTLSSGLAKIKPSMDESARAMGESPWGVLRHIHFSMMKSTVLTALLLVFVDVLKELPATIMLRPVNFNTLAVRAHEMASDERLVDAGPPALMIVLVSLLPIIILSRGIQQSRAGSP